MDIRHTLPEYSQSLLLVIVNPKPNPRSPRFDEFLNFVTEMSVSTQCSCPTATTNTPEEGRQIARGKGLGYCLFIYTGSIVSDLRLTLHRLDETRPICTPEGRVWFETLQPHDPWIKKPDAWILPPQKIWWADPETNPEALECALMDDGATDRLTSIQQDFVSYARLQKHIFSNRVYFIDGEDPKFDVDPTQTSTKQFYGVPSSLKLEYMAYRYGFDDNTRVFYIDISQDALDYRLTMIRDWDGTNYRDFVYDYMHTHNMAWQVEMHRNADERFRTRAEIMFNAWSSPEEFTRFWQEYVTKVKFHFVNINLITEGERLIEMVEDDSVVSCSNVFDYPYSAYVHKQQEIEEAHQYLLTGMEAKQRVTVYERWSAYAVPRTS